MMLKISVMDGRMCFGLTEYSVTVSIGAHLVYWDRVIVNADTEAEAEEIAVKKVEDGTAGGGFDNWTNYAEAVEETLVQAEEIEEI